jgi:transcriptional regulator with XRE-family HTH domain
MVDLREILAKNLGKLRRARHWTQEELADRVALSSRYVGQLERAQASASVTVLGRLADALGVEPAELLRVPEDVEKPGDG